MSEAADNPNGRNGHNGHLTSGRLLAKNTLWNLLGNGAPMILAVFSIPILIHRLGEDCFGVLALAWALIGYASLFDLGLGRALTQVIARKLGTGKEQEVPSMVWTSLVLMLLLGVVGAVVVVALSPWMVHRVLKVPAALQAETLRSFYLLGISIPAVILTAGLRAVLEAHQRFAMINALRIPLGVYSYVGPLLILPFSKSLVHVVGMLVVGRLIGLTAHAALCLRVAPELFHRIAWHRAVAKPLLRLGGWMTVSNIVGPLMVTLDRFLLGALVSMAAVAYYATPYEVVTKLWLIPGALVGVMFPAFSTSSGQDPNRTALLFGRSVKCLLVVLFPVVLLTVALAYDGLKLWLGAEFARNSAHVLQWLAVGVLINSLAQVPFALLQGVGKPDLTAKLHLIELPLYFAALWWLTKTFGIEGAAMAWTARVTADALFLFGLARRLVPGNRRMSLRIALLPPAAMLVLGLASTLEGAITKAVFLLATTACFAFVAWHGILTAEERALAQGYLS